MINKIKKFFKRLFMDVKISNLIAAFVGGLILAFVIRNIHEVSPITEGGMLGLTLLIDHWLHISPSITTPILNVICYLFAFKILGRSFIINSTFAIIGYSGFLAVFELFPPLWPEISEMPLVASIVGGIGVGLSCGICVLAKSAPTADDAVVLGLVEKIKIPITVIYMISDITVLALSLTYIDWQLILYSLLTVIISGQLIGIMQKIFDKYMLKKSLKEENIQRNELDTN